MTDVLYRKASGTRLQRSGLSAAASAPLQLEREVSLMLACRYRYAGRQDTMQRCTLNPARIRQSNGATRTRALGSEPAWLRPERLGHGGLVDDSQPILTN